VNSPPRPSARTQNDRERAIEAIRVTRVARSDMTLRPITAETTARAMVIDVPEPPTKLAAEVCRLASQAAPAGADEIVIATLPAHRRHRLEHDLIHLAGRRFGLPVDHVIAAPAAWRAA